MEQIACNAIDETSGYVETSVRAARIGTQILRLVRAVLATENVKWLALLPPARI
jgi:hypothetical protein